MPTSIKLEEANYAETLAALPRYRRLLRLIESGLSNARLAEIEGVSRQRISILRKQIKRAQGKGWLP